MIVLRDTMIRELVHLSALSSGVDTFVSVGPSFIGAVISVIKMYLVNFKSVIENENVTLCSCLFENYESIGNFNLKI